jgi:ribosomal protein S7
MEGIELLKLIKTISFKFEPQVYKPLAIDDAMRKFMSAKQGKQMQAAESLEQFQNHLDVLEAMGATIGPHRGVINMITGEAGVATPVQINEANELSIAVAFINNADKTRYGRLLEDLRNNYLMGQDNYPKTLNSAYNLLVNWQQDPRYMIHYGAGPNDGMVFAHQGDKEAQASDDAEGTTLVQERQARGGNKHITCFKCKKKGHYKGDCPLVKAEKESANEESASTNVAYQNVGCSLTINPLWTFLAIQCCCKIFGRLIGQCIFSALLGRH